MPSPSKFSRLEAAKYRIRPSCSLCTYFVPRVGSWGHCWKHTYVHEKHNGERALGVHATGVCDSFYLTEQSPEMLQSYERFLEKQ